jgi:hypothetical protein
MIRVQNFIQPLMERLPETFAILCSANLTVHENVSRIILHGSRGLKNCFRFNSDIDLTLIADLPTGVDINLLDDVFHTTMSAWKSATPLDLAVVFEVKRCGLRCFEHNEWNDGICRIGGMDCFGLYKIGKGFDGLVREAGVQVRLMYPCLKIWERLE